MMTEKEAVKKALLISMEHELSCINSDLSGEPEPNFSHGFEEGMRRLINDQKSGAITPDKTTYISALSEHHSGEGVREYKTIKIGRRHFRRVFVIALAALLILAMTMIGIGIVRPGIYYKVIESIGSWDITPVHEGDQQNEVGSSFVPIEPDVPDTYEITEKSLDEVGYNIEYSDAAGHEISYYQFPADTSTMYLNTGEATRREIINDREAIITEYEDSCSIVINNGDSVMSLSGDCDYQELYDIAYRLAKMVKRPTG